MRKDFKYLNVSLGFSTMKACPLSFIIASSALSPRCLFSYKNPLGSGVKMNSYDMVENGNQFESKISVIPF